MKGDREQGNFRKLYKPMSISHIYRGNHHSMFCDSHKYFKIFDILEYRHTQSQPPHTHKISRDNVKASLYVPSNPYLALRFNPHMNSDYFACRRDISLTW